MSWQNRPYGKQSQIGPRITDYQAAAKFRTSFPAQNTISGLKYYDGGQQKLLRHIDEHR